MTAHGDYDTETSDMIAVHQALLGSLDAAPSLIGRAAGQPDRVELIGSFYENLLEFLHVHHAGEDEVIYSLLEERCPHEKTVLEQIERPTSTAGRTNGHRTGRDLCLAYGPFPR